ncbi:CLUMA_CG011339, isoform A [Clunio marinus]|uniref:CLUMA_CG011339, isoform A n=1 Tax=Clunio marinus TaxID=568069 RepID=A0A1J1ICF3_9DIPT|nr:CLUMA_CG011339, isoform A [Clunio marinus]
MTTEIVEVLLPKISAFCLALQNGEDFQYQTHKIASESNKHHRLFLSSSSSGCSMSVVGNCLLSSLQVAFLSREFSFDFSFELRRTFYLIKLARDDKIIQLAKNVIALQENFDN